MRRTLTTLALILCLVTGLNAQQANQVRATTGGTGYPRTWKTLTSSNSSVTITHTETAIDLVAQSGGGSSPWTFLKRTSADTTCSANTGTPTIGRLEFPVSAATDYEFEFFIPFSSAATTTGIVLGVSCPASPTWISYIVETPIAADGAGGQFQGWGTSSADMVIGTGVQATGTVYLANIRGVLRNGANAGAVKVVFRSEVSASAVTAKQGAWGKYRAF